MKQFALPLNLSHRRTRKREFLDAMERAVPWAALLALIAPLAPRKRTGRPPFALEAMLRIHFLQQWFSLSDLAMEEALFDVPLYREFAGLGGMSRLPDRVSILRFRHLLEEHRLAEQFLQVVNAHLAKASLMLKEGTMVDDTLIAAPSSTKNQGGERDPEMHQVKKGNQWHFGMKAHIGADADSGLVHTVVGTAANVNDVTQAPKTRIRAKVGHPFRVIKRQLGHVKVRYRGLMKNTQPLFTLFALPNLWMVRARLLNRAG